MSVNFLALRKNIVKKHWYLVSFTVILFVAALLRLYRLGEVPHGMTWDEAAIGYNGFSIWETRRDEWQLERFPVSFKSFGDYKAPLAIYLNAPFTKLFGLNLWAVRLPFALSGVAAVAGMMLLVAQVLRLHPNPLQKHREKKMRLMALFAGGLMAVSPWHLHFSRGAFEVGIALTLIIWGMLFLVRTLEILLTTSAAPSKKLPVSTWLMGTLAVVCLVASLYTYHSAKLVTPLLVGVTGLWFWRLALRWWYVDVMMLVLGGILLWPLLQNTLYGQGGERFFQATIFGEDHTLVEILQLVGSGFLQHLAPDFLLSGATTNLRHGSGEWGVLFPTTFFSLVSALVVYLGDRRTRANGKGLVLFAICWLIIGIFPAAIGKEVPHALRSLLALPGYTLLVVLALSYGLERLHQLSARFNWIGSKGEERLLVPTCIGVFCILHGAFFLSYFKYYYTDFAQASASDFQDGYLETFSLVTLYEKGRDGKPQVEKIIFTTDYGQPYIYALFSRKTNPLSYQHGSLQKYEFTEKISSADLLRPNALIVASNQDDIPAEQATHLVYGSDGEIRFKIYLTEILEKVDETE